jgi:hypothetical protein
MRVGGVGRVLGFVEDEVRHSCVGSRPIWSNAARIAQ